MKRKLLFLCTGNSARSQMAEGLARHWGGEKWDVASAGIEPSRVHPLAIAAMAELDIDISHHTSQPVTRDLMEAADLIITLCGDAKDRCPLTPHKQREHWPLPDPARVTGGEEKKHQAFREVRDDLVRRVQGLLQK